MSTPQSDVDLIDMVAARGGGGETEQGEAVQQPPPGTASGGSMGSHGHGECG